MVPDGAIMVHRETAAGPGGSPTGVFAKPIVVVSENGQMASDVAAALRGQSAMCVRLRHVSPALASAVRSVIVDLDLRAMNDPGPLLAKLSAFSGVPTLLLADAAGSLVLKAHATAQSSLRIIVRPTTPEAIAGRILEMGASRGDRTIPVDAPSARERLADAGASAHGVSAAIEALTDAFADVAAERPMDLAPFGPASMAFVTSLRNAVATDAGLDEFLRVIEQHHSATLRHSLSVTVNAVLFGLRIDLGRAELASIAEAALLHDIGKAVVPLDVLDKPGPLTPEESAIIRAHPSEGERLLRRARQPVAPMIARVVRHHHEYLDGSGYPDGIKADFIPDLVRLTTVADVFTALVEDRPYKKPMRPNEAVGILKRMADDGKVDPVIVARFSDMVGAML